VASSIGVNSARSVPQSYFFSDSKASASIESLRQG
jgi:hypothetical protein